MPIQADRPRQCYTMTSIAATWSHALSKGMLKRPAVGYSKKSVLPLLFVLAMPASVLNPMYTTDMVFWYMKHAWV